LTTKLYIPHVRPLCSAVSHPRLTKRLNAGLNRKLTLISAPAGFDEPALLSEWSEQNKALVIQVSLDENEDHPARISAPVVLVGGQRVDLWLVTER
jgi:LuxR family maltose regulon positive regulatory protein